MYLFIPPEVYSTRPAITWSNSKHLSVSTLLLSLGLVLLSVFHNTFVPSRSDDTSQKTRPPGLGHHQHDGTTASARRFSPVYKDTRRCVYSSRMMTARSRTVSHTRFFKNPDSQRAVIAVWERCVRSRLCVWIRARWSQTPSCMLPLAAALRRAKIRRARTTNQGSLKLSFYEWDGAYTRYTRCDVTPSHGAAAPEAFTTAVFYLRHRITADQKWLNWVLLNNKKHNCCVQLWVVQPLDLI